MAHVQRNRRFGLTRKMLTRIKESPRGSELFTHEKFVQRLCLATYKDPDLPMDQRLDGRGGLRL
jgi:hypothetical protein